ncbi:MAG: ComEC/Rec2 family competence protein [Cyanobacteria bacterium P01_D01_bin.115]
MNISVGLAFCVAYVAGLLLSSAAGYFTVGTLAISRAGVIVGLGLLGLAAIASRYRALGWRSQIWATLACVYLLASGYMTVRSPVAGSGDISAYVERAQSIAPTHVIAGRVIEEPRLNRALKGRFVLQAERLQIQNANGEITFQIATQGRLYMTAPLLQVTGLHRGQLVTAVGRLYRPQAAKNPGGFDFASYLGQRGIFAGFVATDLQFPINSRWGLWRVRQRIVRSHLRALGSPLGQLVSAMALGRKAVDLPANMQALFAQVGLAHTIAASGFHVSLLLGTVLALLRSRTARLQVVVGIIVLVGYVTLTGWQASVIRAAIMGLATLAGLATNRQVIPSGALVLAATAMLLVYPQWLWHAGFQLSVTATWGLIVTVPEIVRRLKWMPVTVASLVAVPVAATLWTLPLMLYHFNVISGISILLNVVATPLVTVISLGGIASSACALLLPTLGQLSAQLLYYPTQGLVWLAQTSSHLPGSAVAIGQISLWQLAGLYSVLFLSLCPLRSQVKRLRPWLPVVFVGLLLVPMAWQSLTQNQITVLAADDELIWIRQVQGQTMLINSGDQDTAFYTVEPFLKQAGVNQIDEAIALSADSEHVFGWRSLLQRSPSRHLYSSSELPALTNLTQRFQALQPGHSQAIGQVTMQLLGIENPILRVTAAQSWLLLPPLSPELQAYLAQSSTLLESHVLVWAGGALSDELLAAVNPKVVICYGRNLSEAIERRLRQADRQVFWTQRDGAVTWHHQHGFHAYLETKHRNAQPWA